MFQYNTLLMLLVCDILNARIMTITCVFACFDAICPQITDYQ